MREVSSLPSTEWSQSGLKLMMTAAILGINVFQISSPKSISIYVTKVTDRFHACHYIHGPIE